MSKTKVKPKSKFLECNVCFGYESIILKPSGLFECPNCGSLTTVYGFCANKLEIGYHKGYMDCLKENKRLNKKQ